jgi:hypothetical protein
MHRPLIAAALLLTVPLATRAHCDTLDGPVVKTARAALDANDVAPVLAWVKAPDEGPIRAAFADAVAARARSPGQREASERRFLETLVRVHRAGEGAPFTGLKPAGEGVPQAVRMADRAVETGDASALEEALVGAVRRGVRDRFAELAGREQPGKDVAAGRRWVEAYVEYVHFVEALDAVAHRAGGSHHAEAGPPHAQASTARASAPPHAHEEPTH